MKRALCLLVSIIGVVSLTSGLNFKQVSYIPSGVIWNSGYIKGWDANNDGYQDLIFRTYLGSQWQGTVFWGYRPFNRYVFQDSTRWPLFWDIGYLDSDSLLDMLTQYGETLGVTYIRVYESFNRNEFPKQPTWTWRYEFNGNGVQAMYITDLDRDGQNEILTGDTYVIYVFECRGDNNYQKVFWDTVTINPDIWPNFAVGDFDRDSMMEFVISAIGGRPNVLVYECSGDDRYQIVFTDTLPTFNMNDDVTGPDLDGDGILEFILGDLHGRSPIGVAGLWIYEAIGNNQYEIVYQDSVPNLTDRGVYAVHSDCGDVDRDGKPELVWAIDRDWMVYKSPGNNQFQRVFSAYGDNGHNTTNIHIHDMNGNGYPEVIESGGNETHIWEVQPVKLDFPNGGELLYADSLCVIQWHNEDPFRADSFSLFFSADSGLTYSPIALRIPGTDSTYLWTVPDTVSSRCFIMLWAYQNAIGWDFSDGPFTIQPASGVEVLPSHASRLTPYVVSPNPFLSHATIPGHEAERFALYDVSGRKVGVYKGDKIGFGLSAGIYFLRPEGQNAKLLRIVKLR